MKEREGARMKSLMRALGVLAVAAVCAPVVAADEPVNIGSRRELFVDRLLIGEMKNVQLRLHEPREREVVLRHDKPWEGKYAGYTTVIKDGSTYRMYYRGLPDDGAVDGLAAGGCAPTVGAGGKALFVAVVGGSGAVAEAGIWASAGTAARASAAAAA